MPVEHGTISFRLEGYDAPGKSCPAPDGIGLGIQEGQSVSGVLMSSEPEPRFRGRFNVTPTDDRYRLDGPFVHGPASDWILYLAWIHLKSRVTMAQITLRLADIDPALILQAREENAVPVGKVKLTTEQGKPASGSLRPPLVSWSIESE